MLDLLGDHNAAALVGLVGGVMLGLAARLGRFCTLGAIEDMLYAGSTVRMRMWGIAIGTAMAGSFLLMNFGLLNASDTIYLRTSWVPWASVVGGLVFGYGMALAGNCGFGALARLGGGDLRSFVIVLVMGLAAYVAISGPFARLRITAFPERPLDPGQTLPSLPHLAERLTGVSAPAFGIAVGVVMVLAVILTSAEMRKARKEILWSVIAGLAVVVGWAGTQYVFDTGFTPVPVESHTYSAPLGDTILYLMTASGSTLNFGVGSVAGVMLGAFIGSTLKGHFRWEACEDPRELKRQIGGAVLMGFGGVVAFGCSIGQGLTAFSLLYYGAPVTFLAIMAGAALGLRHLISGFAPAE